MKRGKHYIKIREGYLLVEGAVFNHRGFEFFAHRGITSRLKNGRFDANGKAGYYSQDSGFDVSHLRTGFRMHSGHHQDTRKKVIAGFERTVKAAENRLDKTLSVLINEGIKLSGLTPEFDNQKESEILKDKLIDSFTWACDTCGCQIEGRKGKPSKLCIHDNNISMTRGE
jgi:hypothetical protein